MLGRSEAIADALSFSGCETYLELDVVNFIKTASLSHKLANQLLKLLRSIVEISGRFEELTKLPLTLRTLNQRVDATAETNRVFSDGICMDVAEIKARDVLASLSICRR